MNNSRFGCRFLSLKPFLKCTRKLMTKIKFHEKEKTLLSLQFHKHVILSNSLNIFDRQQLREINDESQNLQV